MSFANPYFLVLTAIVPLAGLFWAFLRARREKALARMVAPSLQSRLLPKGANLWGLQAFLILAGLALSLFAAARPQWGRTIEKRLVQSRNVVIAIDVSRSMLAEDVRPSRLERVKADVADLIDSLQDDRCALVAFRKSATAICPLTTDRGFLRQSLDGLSPEMLPRGETDIGAAIAASLETLEGEDEAHSMIIVISDGGDLKEREQTLNQARLAEARGVPIFTIGVGDPGVGAKIPVHDGRGGVSYLQYEGKDVEVRLDERLLKEIAEATKGGSYVPLATSVSADTTLGAVYRRVSSRIAREEQHDENETVAERYQIFLVAGIAFLILGASLSKGRLRRS